MGIAVLSHGYPTPPPRCAERVGELSSAPTTCSPKRLRVASALGGSVPYGRSSPLDPSTPPGGDDGCRRSPPSAFSPAIPRVFCVAPMEAPEIPISRSPPTPRVLPTFGALGVFWRPASTLDRTAEPAPTPACAA